MRTFLSGGFSSECPSLKEYFQSTQQNPEKHASFLTARSKLIMYMNKADNQMKRLSRGGGEKRKVEAINTVEDQLFAPEEEFVELAQWQEDHREFAYNGVPADPTAAGLVVITKALPGGKVVEGVVVMVGRPGRYKMQRKCSSAVVNTERVADEEDEEIRADICDIKQKAAQEDVLATHQGASLSSEQIKQKLMLAKMNRDNYVEAPSDVMCLGWNHIYFITFLHLLIKVRVPV